MSETRVSVIVPAYRRPDSLRTLLESLARQSLPADAFEVVISDDGSGTDVAEVAEAYKSRFAHLTLVTGPNAGPGVARNRGAARAAAPLLAFVDSDCVASRDWLHALVSAAERGGELFHGPVKSTVPPIEPFVHSFMVHDEVVCGGNFGIRRPVFATLGGFDSRVSRIAEDHEFFTRAARAGIKPVFVPQAEVTHPPRLKSVRVPFFGGEQMRRISRDSRAFYELTPEFRAVGRATKRRLLVRGSLKLALTLAPAALTPLFPMAPLVGPGTALFYAFVKRRRANRVLAAAGEGFRVPMTAALKYGLLLPVLDLMMLLEYGHHGILGAEAPRSDAGTAAG